MLRKLHQVGQLGLIASIFCLTSGCDIVLRDSIRGSGVLLTEQRSVADFQELSVGGAVKVQAYCGEDASLELSGDDNILEHVVTEVKDGTLHIHMESGSYSLKEPLLATITCKSMTRVDVSGASTVNVEGISADEFDVEMSGASRVTLEGKTDKLTLNASGASKFYSDDLTCREVDFDISGTSNANVYASESVRGGASGASQLRYAGNPSETEVSSSGASKVTPVSGD